MCVIRYGLAILVVASLQALIHADELPEDSSEGDFKKAFEEARETPTSSLGLVRYAYEIGYEAAKADRLLARNLSPDVEFLIAKARDPKAPRDQRLAIIVLGKLSGDPRAKQEILRLASDESRFAVRALSYMRTDDARDVAERLMVESRFTRVKAGAADILAAVGNEESLGKLTRRKEKEKGREVKLALERATTSLQYRLEKLPKEKRAEWSELELKWWRARQEAAETVKFSGRWERAATYLQFRGHRFPPEFLRLKLDTKDVLAIVVAGRQKETGVVQLLENLAMQRGSRGQMTRRALIRIGDDAALSLVAEALRSGDEAVWKLTIGDMLFVGDARTLALMGRLKDDKTYSKKTRHLLRNIWEALEKKLEKQPPKEAPRKRRE